MGYPHEIKGQGIYAYVTLMSDTEIKSEFNKEIISLVRSRIGPHATLDKIQFATGLPKTRSGKIMRRILRKIAEGDISNLGDISTLAEPSVIEKLVNERL